MRKFLQFIGGGLLLAAAGCPVSVPALCDYGACESGDGGADGDVADASPDVVKPPDGCDPGTDPKDAPKCVVSEYGVFVDATGGSDGNPGTKESPVKSIGGALEKLGAKTRVYVCEGTYAEHVKLTSAVSIYGGFACGAWSYSGTKPKVAPGSVGYALEIADTAGDVTVSDLSFVAANALDKGQSSIAAFVHKASKVLLVRSDLQAGTGKESTDGDGGAPGTITAVSGGGSLIPSGYPASGTTAGTIKTCTCATGGTSSGASGGGPAGAGAPGMPSVGAAPPADGAGGAGNVACNPTGAGHNGGDASAAGDGPKVTALGTLDAKGWVPQAGAVGSAGTPAQGGGGGGGRDGAGGGAGCGGCGATGGRGGGGGGASVALLSFDSNVVLRTSSLTAKNAGPGGLGGAKGIGATGGSGRAGGSAGVNDGCPGGDGGRGGDGGTGSGGAGGVSAAVLHKGAAPANEGSTLTPGTKGNKGVGGTAGTNDGPDGQQTQTLEIQ